jgi:hypothetical protein
MKYRNLDLEAFDYKMTGDTERFRVRVADSPVGQQRLVEAEGVTLPPDLRQRLRRLDKRALTLPEMIALGEDLAAALFPSRARSFLERSRERLADDEGLRIRLRLDTYALADLPWEYAYLPRPGTPADQKGPEGFLVLDRGISLVRYEVLGQAPGSLDPVGTGALRLVALLANPNVPGYPALKLDVEQQNIAQALSELPNIRAEFYPNATADTLLEALAREAHVFHFAGHGKFEGDLGMAYGSVEGKGYLVFVDEDPQKAFFSAEKLALNLKGRGVRLAVLGACEGGRRDQVNAWTGIVPALTRAGIPAVVGMQYTIRDVSAIAFSRYFYRALAVGQPIDAAMTDGRLAIFNRGSEDERDWGVPVLYLRAEEGILFPQAAPAPAGPRVVSTAPPNGAVGVSRRLKSIQITFDRPMHPSARSISSTGWFGLERAQVEYNPATYTFTITRDNIADPLPANTVISFTVNPPGYGPESGFFDLAGDRAEMTTFSFTTGAELEEAGKPCPPAGAVDKRALREAIVKNFSLEELEVLCADVQQALEDDGVELQVNLEMVGGVSKTGKVLNLIEYLDRRGHLDSLIAAVRVARGEII